LFKSINTYMKIETLKIMDKKELYEEFGGSAKLFEWLRINTDENKPVRKLLNENGIDVRPGSERTKVLSAFKRYKERYEIKKARGFKRKKTVSKYTPEIIQQIVELKESGVTAQDALARFGFKYSTELSASSRISYLKHHIEDFK